jgi:hypothetical protein
MSPRSDLREPLTKAVNLIVNTQNNQGGWRYQPQRRDADISVTIAQVMALRAARNAGLHVPRETIDASVDYVKRSQNPDGGFMYMLQGGQSAFPRSAAGVVAFYSAGIYEGPELEKGLAYLDQFNPAISIAKATIFTATTTPCKPCGRLAATAGTVGTPAFAMRYCRARATKGAGWIASAWNTVPPWPASFCSYPTIICRSFNASHTLLELRTTNAARLLVGYRNL